MSDAATTEVSGSRSASPVLTVTEVAIERILELRANEDDPTTLGLRIEVTGQQGVEYTYDLSFDSVAAAAEGDLVFDQGGLPVLVPADSAEHLRGATLDIPSSEGQAGLVLRNPNRPDPMGIGDIELTGTPEEQVRTLLDQRVNPALAAHGGYAELERIEGATAFVTMGGGCQGCAVSAMTLREGISRSIVDAVEEITEVVDVTNHDEGENPYY